jgi:hypothetical protein
MFNVRLLKTRRFFFSCGEAVNMQYLLISRTLGEKLRGKCAKNPPKQDSI